MQNNNTSLPKRSKAPLPKSQTPFNSSPVNIKTPTSFPLSPSSSPVASKIEKIKITDFESSQFWEPPSGSLIDNLRKTTNSLTYPNKIQEKETPKEEEKEEQRNFQIQEEQTQTNLRKQSKSVDKTILVLKIASKTNAIMKNCYNCNTPISRTGFGSTARFCEYFGEYFCKQCHLNQESIVPAHIIQQWDFGRYKVSDLALRTLRNAIDSPVIPVPSSLYTLSKRMGRNKELR